MEDELLKWAEQIFGSSGINDALSILNQQFSLGDAFSSVYNNVILPIGYFLLLIYFCLDLMDRLTFEQFSMEQFVKQFIKFVIGLFVISNGMDFFLALYSFCGSLTSSITTTIGSQDTGSLSLIKSKIEDTDMIGQFALIALLLIPKLIMFVTNLIIQVVLYSRVLEIGIRTLFAPIAIADIYQGFSHSAGFRYIKKYAAVCLQGAIVVGIIYLGNQIVVGGNVQPTDQKNAILSQLQYELVDFSNYYGGGYMDWGFGWGDRNTGAFLAHQQKYMAIYEEMLPEAERLIDNNYSSIEAIKKVGTYIEVRHISAATSLMEYGFNDPNINLAFIKQAISPLSEYQMLALIMFGEIDYVVSKCEANISSGSFKPDNFLSQEQLSSVFANNIDIWSLCFMQIVISITIITFILKAQSIANDILGV